ncbi:MAG: carboxylating nicotinate-nucleotide diphosphorylase [Heliobacteriaceae bacterium]|jgi:nicotinate-nucleotide pyrophosphorylase (carboxylating)|nr:carboxylating nicotinate-nucleotide diphosphorylase [Heliobacteriaceae bacterium]
MEEHVKAALTEDIGFEDITTENLAADGDLLSASLNTRSDGILCGSEVFKTVFKMLSNDVKIVFYFKDGDEIKKGDKIADISGPAKHILTGERTALNYIQRMSGIAAETKKYRDAAAPYPVKIVDTRKTTPNFRAFEKYAVKTGGGSLHRFNLSDCAMIKDNHIKLAGSVTAAVNKLRPAISHVHKIEVECDTLEQVKEALECKADIIMLDNMSLARMKQACELINHAAIVEASGNVRLETVRAIAACGVDIISSGAIIAQAPTLDLALDI